MEAAQPRWDEPLGPDPFTGNAGYWEGLELTAKQVAALRDLHEHGLPDRADKDQRANPASWSAAKVGAVAAEEAAHAARMQERDGTAGAATTESGTVLENPQLARPPLEWPPRGNPAA